MSDQFKIITTSTALLMIGGLSTAALAAGPQLITVTAGGQQTISVAYDDLRLDNAKGMKTLERRINHAAAVVCNKSNGKRPLAEMSNFKACYKTAKADAMTASIAIAEAQKANRAKLAAR